MDYKGTWSLWARGSKYLIFEVSGSKSHTLHGFWAQGPEILGTWTLREKLGFEHPKCKAFGRDIEGSSEFHDDVEPTETLVYLAYTLRQPPLKHLKTRRLPYRGPFPESLDQDQRLHQ